MYQKSTSIVCANVPDVDGHPSLDRGVLSGFRGGLASNGIQAADQVSRTTWMKTYMLHCS